MRKTLSAYEKVIDYLSRRDHSEHELKNKLSQKGFTSEEVELALEAVRKRGFIQQPTELANKVAETLHNKLKGILYIQEYLKSKELPSVETDWDLELKKAQKLIQKQSKTKDNEAILRLLASRGFAETTIEKIMRENNYEKH